MTSLEWIAALLIVVNVALVARRSIWNYPFAIAGVAIYAVVFANARLYSDMLLQGFFLVLNVYGWVTWRRAQERLGEVAIGTLSTSARLAGLAAIAAATLAWGGAMHRFTDASYPWWDAAIAIASVAAQWLQARRRLESWALWIAVDIASVGLYAAKRLWPTTALYVVLLALACWGLIGWWRAAIERRRGA